MRALHAHEAIVKRIRARQLDAVGNGKRRSRVLHYRMTGCESVGEKAGRRWGEHEQEWRAIAGYGWDRVPME